MPILRDSEDIYDEKSETLALEFNLLRLETQQNQTKFEGWLEYSLTIYDGEKQLVQRVGAIHEDDVKFLEGFLGKLKADSEDYEPIEPDFVLGIKHVNEEEWALSCMVNYGEVKHKYYGHSAIGIRLLTDESNARKFADELKEQRISLTKEIERG